MELRRRRKSSTSRDAKLLQGFWRKSDMPQLLYGAVDGPDLSGSVYFAGGSGALGALMTKSLAERFALGEPPSMTRSEEPGLPGSFASI
jgi:hypothetical protein